MLTADDVRAVAVAIAKTNAHPEAGDYADAVVAQWEEDQKKAEEPAEGESLESGEPQ